MNPKVSPSAINLVPHPGKKRVFRKQTTGIPSKIKESGIPSHIKDAHRPRTANYDLSLLDVVPAAAKDTPPKTKHVHFLPEDTYISGRPTDVTQAKPNVGHKMTSRSLAPATSPPQPGRHKLKTLNGCTSGHVRTNDHSDSAEVFLVAPKVGKASTRRGSVNCESDHAAVIVHRSNSLPTEHNNRNHSCDTRTRKPQSKPNSPMARSKDKRFLPATPAVASPAPQDRSHMAQLQEVDLSVNLSKSVLHSPTPKHTVSPQKIVASNASLPKQRERKGSNPEPRYETYGSQAPQPDPAVTYSNHYESCKPNNLFSPPTKHKHSQAKSKMADGQVQTAMNNGAIINGCSPTKQPCHSQGTSVSASDLYSARTKQGTSASDLHSVRAKQGTSASDLHSARGTQGSSASDLHSVRGTQGTSASDLHSARGTPGTSASDLHSARAKQGTSVSASDLHSARATQGTSVSASDLHSVRGTQGTSASDLHSVRGTQGTSASDLHSARGTQGTSASDLHSARGTQGTSASDLHGARGTQGTSASDLDSVRGTHLHQRQRCANVEHKDSVNCRSAVKPDLSSLQPLDQVATSCRRLVADNPSLTASSSPSSLNPLSKEVLSAGVCTLPSMSSLSSTPRTKRSQSGRVTEDQPLLFPLSELSSSSLSVSSSLSTSSSHTRSRRSPSYSGSDSVFDSSWDPVIATQLAQKDGQPFHPVIATQLAQKDGQPLHSLSRPAAGKDGDTRRGDISGCVYGKTPLYGPTVALKETNRNHRPTQAKKQSIAASYQLDYCWFCGRAMPAFGTSLNGDQGEVDKLADLERRLTEALSEKVKLQEEQTRLKESEMAALQQIGQFQRQLSEMKAAGKSAQEVQAPGDHSTPDLRAYLESLGHQLDICQHVQATRHCCRGLLHKMGRHLNIWRKRWFVFDSNKSVVSYFTDKTERKARGTLCLQTVLEVYLDHPRTVKSPDPKVTFCLKTYHRTYYLMAPSAVAMAIWIDVLLSAAQGYKGGDDK